MRSLVLFFGYKDKLKIWFERGFISREINYYEKLSRHFDVIYWVTYGMPDGQYNRMLPKKIIVLPKKYPCPDFVYSLLLPIIYRHELRGCSFLKTNQMLASWTAVIAKILYRKALYVRTGYTLSLSRFAPRNLADYWKEFLIWLIEKLAFTYADYASVTDQEQKSYVAQRYHVNPEKIIVVPNAINTALFRPIEVKEDNPSTKNTELLFVGRLAKEKNLLNVFKAVGDIPNLHLTIIGKGELRERLVGYAKTHHLPVDFIDFVNNDDLPMYYNKADVYIQPSSYEGNPKTIMEAMACGCVCLGTNVRGIRGIIEHKKNGWLVDSTDSQSIKDGLQVLLKNAGLRKRLGQQARKTIGREHSMERIIKQELKIYRN